jgi:hypothetical protein
MIEAEWLNSSETWPMLQYLRGRTSPRKLRLFACACCRRIDERFLEPAARHLLETAERFADRRAKKPELEAADQALQDVRVKRTPEGGFVSTARDNPALESAREAIANLRLGPNEAADNASVCVANFVARRSDPVRPRGSLALPRDGASIVRKSELRVQAELLRHIVGNPFKPINKQQWPRTAVELARALYSGSDCNFALHDALLEAGHAELAEHFRDKDHPKGCWTLDLILGKK